MGLRASIAILSTILLGCDRSQARSHTADTSMVFVETQSPPLADSAFSARLLDTVRLALQAHSRGLITADSAAKVAKDYLDRTHRSLSIPLDSDVAHAFINNP